MKSKKNFNNLIKISLAFFLCLLIFGVAIKAIMPADLIPNYNFLSTMTAKQRFIRGLKLVEFYKTEAQIGVIKRTLVLDVLNLVVFIPFGILITNSFKRKRILKAVLITFLLSLAIEIFQLITVIGSFMLNDLIFNTLGGLVGSLIFITVTVKERYKIYNILLIVFLAVCSILLSYLIYNFISNINIYINILAKKA